MLAVRLPKGLDQRLEALARKTRRSKSYYVRRAVLQFLEDREDYLIGLARLRCNNPRIQLEEVERHLGVED